MKQWIHCFTNPGKANKTQAIAYFIDQLKYYFINYNKSNYKTSIKFPILVEDLPKHIRFK